MAEDALTVVSLRNKFYKDSQRKVMLTLLISIIVNVILASLLVYMVTTPLRQNTLLQASTVVLHPFSR